LHQDYRKTIAAYDSPDTFFFIDPPYPGEWFDPAAAVDLQEFIATLSKIRGKFIAVLNSSPENVRAFKEVGHVFKLRVREASGRGGSKNAMRLFCANYRVQKRDLAELVAKRESDAIAKTSRIIKGVDPGDERYVLGIVLEPETVDAQGDIYSHAEVRSAAHRFMADFGGLGLQHRHRVNDQVKILESYIAPADLTLGDVHVRQGTWLMAVRVLSDALWAQVKGGDLTGFSIGGSARRYPEILQNSEQTP
jgi:DNA adenine methylase